MEPKTKRCHHPISCGLLEEINSEIGIRQTIMEQELTPEDLGLIIQWQHFIHEESM